LDFIYQLWDLVAVAVISIFIIIVAASLGETAGTDFTDNTTTNNYQ
jgi:hypothetical protein